MYKSLPDFFIVQICYIKEDVLGIKINNLYEYTYNSIDKNRKQIVIGLSLPNQIVPRWISDKQFLEKYVSTKDITLKIEDANSDPELQAKQVDNLISQGIDVLLLAPLNASTAYEIVEKAKKAGVKVIAYDRLVLNSDLDLYVSFDNTKVGELQGKFLIDNVPKGNYIILSGDPNDNNSKLYKDGAMKYIRPLVDIGSIKIIADQEIINWDPQNAYDIVNNILNSNNKVDAILAPNDNTASGVIKALEEHGLAGKVAVTGQDAQLPAIKRIVDGTQSMTVLKDVRELGKAAIDSSIKLMNGEFIATNASINNGKINVPTIFISPVLVTRSNITDTLVNTGYIKVDEIYRS
ncbi:D-xylose transport system substrate-binding protein [Clostridium cavendishii DSM 21758]|uniref:D-xylose transport system substrate-binding protein n=1 Tax=Clostridium cavendishii DSM 21758 TaxID=1121302 RepID=A0A1M6I5B0_9CLOT|nr:substrate-binding domain-containing protein [Clostridium cavendishii]SHJ29615.1 D-xylose transport system substrate-binding protein [Clostridium cavendishii DSM 21758]